MLRSQKLEIKSVEIRGRLSELAGLDSLEEDQRTELKEKTAELRQVEEQRVASLEIETLEGEQAEKRDALAAGDVLDPEERERQEILGKARLGNFLRAVIDGKAVQGQRASLEVLTDSQGIMRSRTNCSRPERRSEQLPTLPR